MWLVKIFGLGQHFDIMSPSTQILPLSVPNSPLPSTSHNLIKAATGSPSASALSIPVAISNGPSSYEETTYCHCTGHSHK